VNDPRIRDRPALVSVVTLTKDRPDALLRAVTSVACQAGVRVQHVVIGDDCGYLSDESYRSKLLARFPGVLLRDVRAARHPALPTGYLPARLAYLRNLGTSLSEGEFVAQLDDDNVFGPDHLLSLVKALDARPDAEAAHSWRRVLNPDGTPFAFEGRDPWHPVADERSLSYRRLLGFGVFVDGSNEVRDTLVADGHVVARVDTSEYLARRTLLERIPFPEVYSRWRRKLGYTEDVAFSHELVKQKVVVVKSERATLDYYLGGYSNLDISAQHSHSAGTVDEEVA